MLASMAVSVVVNVRLQTSDTCTQAACLDARSALPWLFGAGLVGACLAVSRLFGPLLVSPAVASWLLSAPVDRTALLRPRLLATGAVGFLVAGVLAAGASTLAGFTGSEVVAYAVVVAATAVLAVGLAALGQAYRRRWARVLTWVLAAVVWTGLVGVTLDAVPAAASAPRSGQGWTVAVVVAVLLAVLATWRAHAALPHVGRDLLTPGGTLVPGLSGALASLDFALVYDILVARYWRSRSSVRAVRGRGTAAGALVWREVVRLRRSPQVLLVLAASVVVPYLGATVGIGAAVLLLATTTGFVAGTALFSSLRVLSRTPSLVRCLPLSPTAVRGACLSVPAAVVVLWALACTPAVHGSLHRSLGTTWGESAALATAVGVTAVTASVRWVSGRPPNYQLPLVTSPMGAVPITLYLSALRGFDALVLGVAPLLISPTTVGAQVSLGLDAVVLAVLVTLR